jgi:hypothetical protein
MPNLRKMQMLALGKLAENRIVIKVKDKDQAISVQSIPLH